MTENVPQIDFSNLSELDDNSQRNLEYALDDFLEISGIPDESIDSLLSDVKGHPHLVTEEAFRRLAHNKLTDKQTHSMLRILTGVDASQFTEMTSWISKGLEDYPAQMELFVRACGKIHRFYGEQQWLAYLQKSMAVVKFAGNELKRIHFVCDARGIFDEAHENLLGFAFLANLVIGYEDQATKGQCVEVALTERDLDLIIEAAIDAKKKLAKMKEVLV